MTQLHQQARRRRFILGDIASANAFQVIDDWRVRVFYLSGGNVTLSALTLACVRDLVNGLMIDGLWSSVIMMAPYPPDDLHACATPIVQGTGIGQGTLWGIFGGMTNANLTVNGLAGGAGLSQYFNTGFQDSAFISPANLSLIHYNSSVTATGFVSGAYTSGANGLIMAAKYTDNNYYSYMGVIASNVISGASPGAGYYCHSRTSTTNHVIYFANSGSPHAQLGATDAMAFGGVFPNQSIFVHADNVSGAPQFYTQDRISFFALTTGLTQAQSLLFFNRIQAYRVAIGGGFV